MKTLGTILAIVLFVFMASQVAAQPYLVCDDAEIVGLRSYIIDIDGELYQNDYPMLLEVGWLPVGEHYALAKAVSVHGMESEWSEYFYFTAGPPNQTTGIVYNGQFITCNDAEELVVSYEVDVNGIIYETGYPLHFDMVGVASVGQNKITVKAMNLWGEALWSVPFEFSVEAPSPPSGLGLSAQ